MSENVETGFIKKASISSFGEISKDQALSPKSLDLENIEEQEEEKKESSDS